MEDSKPTIHAPLFECFAETEDPDIRYTRAGNLKVQEKQGKNIFASLFHVLPRKGLNGGGGGAWI